jgi:hypothetical protein
MGQAFDLSVRTATVIEEVVDQPGMEDSLAESLNEGVTFLTREFNNQAQRDRRNGCLGSTT